MQLNFYAHPSKSSYLLNGYWLLVTQRIDNQCVAKSHNRV
jgi:hypothetical protein